MTDTLVADEIEAAEPTPLRAQEPATPEDHDTQAPQARARATQARSAARNVERPLKAHELFFSTTDAKGVIT